ncbi:MAG: type I methionyl aminopeptidase [Eubacteriales bacterium]|nr:type I methionyl aminopeptidase [Eubacteriales bacterium]
MIIVKNDNEIECMREAGKILAYVHEEMASIIRVGISTYEISEYGFKIIKKKGCTASFYKLYDFPEPFCISLNDVVVHGIPDRHTFLKDGDIISIDGGVCFKGYQSDAARTHIVGNVSNEIKDLVDRTKKSFYEGIKYARDGNHLHDISNAIANYIEPFGYGIVTELVGHGIGKKVHEDPEIPNFKQNTRGPKLLRGMTLAIEPMINLGVSDVNFSEEDGWTVRTNDGKVSAHYENTILITDNEPEILTI